MGAETMAAEGAPMDEKAKRMRDLLSSFYSPDPSVSSNPSSKSATLDTIDTNAFDPNKYMNLLVQNSNLEGILQRHVQMAAEIKNLDTDLQMLVYENYNKFISATDTIKRMKNNIMGMEANTEQLLEKIMSVQCRSDGINASLFEKREHVEKLHRTRNLLRKVQFIYDLPTRLGKCIKSEAYADAVRYYTGAMPILKAYGDSSFQDCKRASEEAVATITKKLQEKVFFDSESIQARAEAVMLLKQLDFPVDSLKVKLLEKLQEFLANLGLVSGEVSNASTDGFDSVSSVAHDASIHEFAEAVRAYRVIFPDSEMQLIKLVHDLVTKHFETVHQYIERQVRSTELLAILRVIWRHVLLMDEVLPEAALHDCTLEAARVALKEHVASRFTRLLHDISDVITKVQTRQEGSEDEYLQVALDATKTTVLQGSMDILLDLRLVLEDNIGILDKLRDFIIDWVQEGFQDFFRSLYDRFLVISGKNSSASADGTQSYKVLPALVLILAQVSVFIEQSAILKITEEIAASFSDGGIRGYENGPAFIPGEICRIYRSAGEKFLYLYINMRTQRISVLLRKRFTTPNWIKHKEPREVHMFVDLLIQELEAIGNEVKQVLPHGTIRKHRRSDSNGSTTSSRSNSLRDDRLSRLNTHKAKSQLLETHLAKLFKQKVEIFTKVEFTQESVLTFIVKLCLKSFLEFVRLQTFNRSGFQQIQLDIQFLRTPLKDTVEDEAAIDFLLDEVIVASAERCLDAAPLEGPILDKLIHSKMEKTKSPYSS